MHGFADKAELDHRAVRFDESGQAYVYLIDENNKISIAEVTTGFDSGTEIEISGLQPSQMVVGPHLSRFTDGQMVEPL